MEQLEKLRIEIDRVDKQLLSLLEERMDLSKDVGEFKKANNIPVVDLKRAGEVIENRASMLKNKDYYEEIVNIFSNIITVSENLQKRLLTAQQSSIDIYIKDMVAARKQRKASDMIVSYQGVKGAFSEMALHNHFKNVRTINCESFEDVFKSISEKTSDYGVVPIENSSTGSIMEVYDLLRKYNCFIVGEEKIKAVQNLIGIKDAKISDIKTVYSHPQGFLQCKDFLNKHKGWTLEPLSNTAQSAKYVKELNDLSCAAIAGNNAADEYDLDILQANINTNSNNYTRFIVIAPNIEIEDDANKISLLFSLPHESGTLSRVLTMFAVSGLNMLKIESRPIQNKNFEYFFFVDIEGNLNDEAVQKAISKLSNLTNYYEILGNYTLN